MSDSFRTIRIDGTDFRQRAIDGEARVLTDAEYADAIQDAAARAASRRTTNSPRSWRTSPACTPPASSA